MGKNNAAIWIIFFSSHSYSKEETESNFPSPMETHNGIMLNYPLKKAIFTIPNNVQDGTSSNWLSVPPPPIIQDLLYSKLPPTDIQFRFENLQGNRYLPSVCHTSHADVIFIQKACGGD